jgi:cell division protein FtsW
MSAFARTDTSLLGRWWWTVDRWTLFAIAGLIVFGGLLTLAASPAVASRIGLDGFHLARRQLVLLPVAAAIVIATSLASPRQVRRIAVIVFLASLALTALTLLAGSEIKGATRWISIAGVSLQPSEFLKPSFAVVAAWMFAAQRSSESRIPGNAVAMALYALVVFLLVKQPDLGMTAVVTAMFFAQFFAAGLPIRWVTVLAAVSIGALALAYSTFPHVSQRIDGFLDPTGADTYQVDRSLEAFRNGGLFGRGPGEGTVKGVLPDAHSDFVFAVAGEELGLLACLMIVGLFAFIVLRGFARLFQETNLFVLYAATGLLVQFGLQALINMGSSLHLIPTKGMTLPFLSYGGSSLLALAFGTGMLLAFTRRRVGTGEA